MGFAAKLSMGMVAFAGVAAAAIFLLSGREEQAVEKRLEQAARAVERGDAEGVIALLSRAYRDSAHDYEGIAQRIRREVAPGRHPQVELAGTAVTVNGDEADAETRVNIKAGPHGLGTAAFRLRLRKEAGVWRIIRAEELR